MGIFDKLFGQKKDSTIQCDEREYMVWKWHSSDKASNKFATISKDATLLVNFGEVAVVIGNRSTGDTFTFIEGPYHDLLGNAYSGDASMVYFINTQGNNQVKFTVPYFDVADPRNVDLPVPVAVSGSIAFTISDYRGFVNLNRLDSFNLTDFNSQTKDALMRHVKSVVANIPIQYEIPLVSLESQISQVNEIVQKELAIRFMNDFGVTLKALDISAIRIDKESKAYTKLKSITQDISVQEIAHQAELKQKVADAEVDVQIKDIREEQEEKLRIRKGNADLDLMDRRTTIEEKHRLQREDANLDILDKKQTIEEKHRLQREQAELDILDKKKEIEERYQAQRENAELKIKSQESIIEENKFAMHAKTEESVRSGRIRLGSPQITIGSMTENLRRGAQIDSNPPSPNLVSKKIQQTDVMPPKPNVQNDRIYHIAINKQQTGPYSLEQIKDMIKQGKITHQTMIWKKGTPNWVQAAELPDISILLSQGEDAPPPLPE